MTLSYNSPGAPAKLHAREAGDDVPARSMMTMTRLGLAAGMATLCTTQTQALDNGLGKKPGLGWNSDYCTNCSGPLLEGLYGDGVRTQGYGDEVFVKHIADHMHTVRYKATVGQKTLQELGFHYVNMDASWDLPNRSAAGELVPDPKLWPSGLDHTVSYVHSLGLGFGLYGDRGTMDCARNPGQFGHEVTDGTWLGKHKIDWFKSDACYAADRNVKPIAKGQAEAIALYRKMGDAMNKSGYPIWYALCGWEPFYAPHGKGLANSARIGPDTGSGWTAVMQNLDNALPVSLDAGPTANGGYWNDGSLQLTPGFGCHNGDSPTDSTPSDSCMTNARFVSMYSIWTVMAFNLLLVGDFAKLNPLVMGTWTNDRMLAINQDSAGIPAVRVDGSKGKRVPIVNADIHEDDRASGQMSVAECGGEPQNQKWILDNMGHISNSATKSCLDVQTCQTWITYQACNKTSSCAPDGSNNEWTLTANGTLQTKLPSKMCATVQKDKTVILTKCTTPVSAEQKWQYDKGTEQLTNGDGMCVTSATGGGSKIKSETIILGRPLSDPPPGGQQSQSYQQGAKSFALLFINNMQKSSTVVCNTACLAKAGVTSGSTFKVTNIVTGAPHLHPRLDFSSDVGGSSSVSATVDGYGASVYLRLDPN